MASDIIRKITLGLNWLIKSGVQSCKEGETKGGFSAWYNADEDSYPFTYTEITGYVLNLLVNMKRDYAVDGIDDCIHLTTTYLTQRAFDSDFGAVKCRFYHSTGWLNNFCTFDNVIVANGLLNKYRMDGDSQAFKVAEMILDTIMNKLAYNNGINVRYISSEDRYQNDDLKWSTQWGSFLSKLSFSFLNIYDLTKKDKYKNFTINMLNRIVKMQRPNGRFITSKRDGTTFLHPYLYSLEGILAAALYLEDDTYMAVVHKGLKWVDTLQMIHGGIAGFVTNDTVIQYDSSDINSQYLRCAIESGYESINSSRIKKIVDRILSCQVMDNDNRRINGGFTVGEMWFFDHSKMEMGPIKNHINTWATIFACDSLDYISMDRRTLLPSNQK